MYPLPEPGSAVITSNTRGMRSENDAGVRAQSAGKYSSALRHFTEAIRLAPTKAAYHSNRAAAALKLGQLALALEDAR